MLDTFTVIAEPHRREILDVLRTRETTVSELVDILAMSQPAVSKHLRVLRDSGLVKVRPLGQQRLYSLNAESLEEISEWIDPYRKYWSNALDRLDAHLGSTRKTEVRRRK